MIITAILLVSHSNTLALDFTYDGTPPADSGWKIDKVSGIIGSDILHAGDGVADGNSLTINSGNGIDGALGGWAATGDVNNNKIDINAGVIFSGTNTSIYGGYSELNGSVTENSVNIGNGVTFSGTNTSIYGGYSELNGSVTENSVNIGNGVTFSSANTSIYGGNSNIISTTRNSIGIGDNVTFSGTTKIYGGWSSAGEIAENSVTIGDGATFSDITDIYGGNSSKSSVVTNNSVTIGKNAKFKNTVAIYGGKSNSAGAVINNSVYIDTATEFAGDTTISGGTSNTGAVTNNSVNISADSKFTGTNTNAYGGHSMGIGAVTGNSITITGATFSGTHSTNIYGGKSDGTGAVTSNSVNIGTGAEITTFYGTTTNIYGGRSTDNSAVEKNRVNIGDSATFSGDTAMIYGGYSDLGAVIENSVNIGTDATFNNTGVTNIYGGYSTNTGVVKRNSVNIGKSTIFSGTTTNIYGGSSFDSLVTENSVNIGTGATFSGTTTGIYGGYALGSGEAVNNSVNITDATFSGTGATSIYGGYSTGAGATENSITINDGTFTTGAVEAIVGGHSDLTSKALPALHNNTITLNSTTLTGLDLSGALITGGQHGTDSTTADIRRAGNKLVIINKVTVGDVRNFEYYDFYMNKSTDDAPLTSTGSVDIGDNAILTINIADNSETIKVGSFIKLIKITGDGTFLGSSDHSVAIQSVSFMYTLAEYKDVVNNIYGMTATSIMVNPLSTAFPESRLASFSFMNQANSLILGQGINSAMESIMVDPSHWALFTVLSGVYSSYDTNVANMKNVTGDTYYGGSSFMLGIAKALAVPTGDMLTGIYFETGYGVIGSRIDTSIQTINTDGNTQYYGGGALLRYSMDNGFYTEGFLRIGALSNDLQSRYLNTIFEHGSTSLYAGIGVNLGYELKLFKDRDMLDFYTNYTWGHLNGSNQNIDNYDYEFNSINSHQVAVGVQYNFIKQRMFSPFIGVSTEYEFDAEATAIIKNDYKISPSNLSGITGVAEVGVRVIPSPKIPLTMALNLGGHFGRRNGIDASFDLEWRFGGKKQSVVDEENRVTEEKKQQLIEEEKQQSIKEENEKIENARIEKEREAQLVLDNQNSEVAKELEKLINDENIKVKSVQEGVAVHVGELLFKTESYELTDDGEKGLKLIINEIKRTYPDKKIKINGHTDNKGDFPYNQKLSVQRAKTIADKMQDNLNKENISYEGKSFNEPIAPNETIEGRAKNRRVEIIIELNTNTNSDNYTELKQ